jgi:hypothetical protein
MSVGLLEASSGLWRGPSPSPLVTNSAVVLAVTAAVVEMMHMSGPLGSPEGFVCLTEEHSRLPSTP